MHPTIDGLQHVRDVYLYAICLAFLARNLLGLAPGQAPAGEGVYGHHINLALQQATFVPTEKAELKTRQLECFLNQQIQITVLMRITTRPRNEQYVQPVLQHKLV